MSELTGDPVLDYLEEMADAVRGKGMLIYFPRSITPCCDDALRVLVQNTRELLYLTKIKVPVADLDVSQFLTGGPRPEIIG